MPPPANAWLCGNDLRRRVMRVLVCAASRHGATAAIAERVGAVLREHSVDVHVRVPAEVAGLDGYEAVVVGSAVYMGRWLARAHRFVVGHRVALSAMPVWLFSSGPVGDPPEPDGEP